MRQYALEADCEEEMESLQVCADYDEECVDVKCKTTCWLYMPEDGICPMMKNK